MNPLTGNRETCFSIDMIPLRGRYAPSQNHTTESITDGDEDRDEDGRQRADRNCAKSSRVQYMRTPSLEVSRQSTGQGRTVARGFRVIVRSFRTVVRPIDIVYLQLYFNDLYGCI
jgi:hypothetical protein